MRNCAKFSQITTARSRHAFALASVTCQKMAMSLKATNLRSSALGQTSELKSRPTPTAAARCPVVVRAQKEEVTGCSRLHESAPLQPANHWPPLERPDRNRIAVKLRGQQSACYHSDVCWSRSGLCMASARVVGRRTGPIGVFHGLCRPRAALRWVFWQPAPPWWPAPSRRRPPTARPPTCSARPPMCLVRYRGSQSPVMDGYILWRAFLCHDACLYSVALDWHCSDDIIVSISSHLEEAARIVYIFWK